MSIDLCTLRDKQIPNTTPLVNGQSAHSQSTDKKSEQLISYKTNDKQICMLSRHLAALLKAGMPLVPALSVLLEQLRSTEKQIDKLIGRQSYLVEVMKQVAYNVASGSTLADAVRQFPNAFSNLFVNMVAAGETSGSLEQSLTQLTRILEKRVNITAKIKSAVAYPAMMIIIAIGVVMFLLAFVVPSLTEIFLEMNKSLPLPTRILISTSAFMKTYLLWIVLAVCVICFAIGLWTRTKSGSFYIDRFKTKLPLFGKLLLKLETARMTRTLGALLISGVPILYALEIVKGVMQNSYIAGSIESVKNYVNKGDTVAAAIKRTGLFPPVIYHILSTSQTGGNIEEGLMEIADMYELEVDSLTKTLLSLLEPSILLVMGVVVGFIVTAVLLPIFEINPAL